MNDNLMSCFTNPIKCKLFLEIHLKGKATAKQLADSCPDIPQATLYRYLNRMSSDGILKIVEENRVRGTIERVYAEDTGLISDVQKLIKENSGEAYLQLFTQFMMGLLLEFKEYASQKDIDLLHDGSGFSTMPFYATLEELADVSKKIHDVIEPLKKNLATPERKMHTLAVIFTPPKTEK